MGFFEYTTYFGAFDVDESDWRDDDPLRNWKCWSCKVERLMMLMVLRMMLTRRTQRRVNVSGTRLSILGSIFRQLRSLNYVICKSQRHKADKIADMIFLE